jgi:hypothetical protein
MREGHGACPRAFSTAGGENLLPQVNEDGVLFPPPVSGALMKVLEAQMADYFRSAKG